MKHNWKFKEKASNTVFRYYCINCNMKSYILLDSFEPNLMRGYIDDIGFETRFANNIDCNDFLIKNILE